MLLLADGIGLGYGLVFEGGNGEDHSCFTRIGAFTIEGDDSTSGKRVGRLTTSFKPFQDCEHTTITII
jgi:hypothetical protein